MKQNLRNLNLMTLSLFSKEIYAGYEAETSAIQDLVEEIRQALNNPDHQLGVWESISLNASEQALYEGFPQIALIYAAHAIAAFQLTPDEYTYGYSQMHGRMPRADHDDLYLDSEVYLAAQKYAAGILLTAQENAARTLEVFQQEIAQDLKNDQDSDAARVLCMNQNDAIALEQIGHCEIEKYAAMEAKRNIYQHELEEIILWSFGSYSGTCPITATDIQYTCDIMNADRIEASEKLKKEQEIAAETLKKKQEETAHNLAKMQNAEAIKLKKIEQQAATELLERQIIQILQKQKRPATDEEDAVSTKSPF